MRALSLLAVLTVLIAPQAAAKSIFDDRIEAYLAREAFRTLCMNHRLDREGALRQAEAEGWRGLTDAESPRVGRLYEAVKGLRLTNPAARWKPSPHGGIVLLLGDGDAGPGCAVAVHAPFRTASSVIGGNFMLPIKRFSVIGPRHDLWVFVEEPGKRRRAVKSYFGKVDHDLIARATANRTLSTIAVMGPAGSDTAVFLYSVPVVQPSGDQSIAEGS